jgi:hypothetical protein
MRVCAVNYFYGLQEHCVSADGDARLCLNLTQPSASQFRSDALASFMVSNCDVPYRQQYLTELMQAMERAGLSVPHSYGQCLHNRDIPKTQAKSRPGEKEAVVVSDGQHFGYSASAC